MIDFALLLILFVGGTWLGGWWAILLVSAFWGWWRKWERPAWIAALAAALAWGFWLALAGSPVTMLKLVDRLERILGAPGPVMLLLPSLYAAILAWSAARLAQGLRPKPR
jgi:hypothetical protein